ncbi:PLD nuclease N-terminal domain-containing protein [Boudabousia liubingyangii]|uniref:PLD nuclease N-terminal domain-containing protein n=1 Tax=Boudabousia liubingyangii TaxID=1921764 RepID=UPI001301587E|nr:PLD nuclease N-terminal domain-containing protein [Boudabousia liubingyangii]
MNLPTSVQVVLGFLIACQLIAMVWALIRLLGDKRERIAGLPRLLWLAIILLGQLIGPVVFLVMQTREHRAIAEQDRFQQARQQTKNNTGKDAGAVISDLYRE